MGDQNPWEPGLIVKRQQLFFSSEGRKKGLRSRFQKKTPFWSKNGPKKPKIRKMGRPSLQTFLKFNARHTQANSNIPKSLYISRSSPSWIFFGNSIAFRRRKIPIRLISIRRPPATYITRRARFWSTNEKKTKADTA